MNLKNFLYFCSDTAEIPISKYAKGHGSIIRQCPWIKAQRASIPIHKAILLLDVLKLFAW